MQSPVAYLKPAFAPESLVAAGTSIGLVGIAGIWAMLTFRLGPSAAHMAAHIIIMNVVAPMLALAFSRCAPLIAPGGLWILTTMQLFTLVAWHAVPLHHNGHAVGWMWPAMLIIVSTAFWLAIFNRISRWHAVAALLLTGKLVCLGAALLIFSPTVLAPSGAPAFDLADQQLAGLLMVTACPLSYITCALVSVAQVLNSPNAAPT